MNVSAQTVSSPWQFHGVRSKCGRDGDQRGGAWSDELVNPERHAGTHRKKKGGFSSSPSPAGRAVVEPWRRVYDFKDFLLQAAAASPLCACFCSGHSSHATLQNTPWVSHSISAQTQTAALVLPAPCKYRRWDSFGATACYIYFSCLCGSFPVLPDLFPTPKGSTQCGKLQFQSSADFEWIWFFAPTWSQITSDMKDRPGLIPFAGLPTGTK